MKKTFRGIAIQTEINGVATNKELTSLFTKALDVCKSREEENPNRSPQYLTSANVTYCVATAESVDLQPIPVVEQRIVDSTDHPRAEFTQIRDKESSKDVEENTVDDVVVQLGDNVTKISGEKDSPARKSGGRKSTPTKRCPVCFKEYSDPKTYEEHLETHPEQEPINNETVEVKKTPVAKGTPRTRNECPVCLKEYVNTKAYEKHLKKHPEPHTRNKEIVEITDDDVVVHLDDATAKTSGDKDVPVKKRIVVTTRTRNECPVCFKVYMNTKAYKKHLKRHPEPQEHGNDVTTSPQTDRGPSDNDGDDDGDDNDDNIEEQNSGEECSADNDEGNDDDDDTNDNDNENNSVDDAGNDRSNNQSTSLKTKRQKKPSAEAKTKAIEKKRLLAKLKAANIAVPKVRKLVTRECQYCKEKFTNSKKFKVHVRKHERLTKERKVYICEYCDKDCKSSSVYKKHVVVHTKERAFPCNLCEKAFLRAQDLTIHIRRHNNVKPYKCSYCSKGFVKKWSMDEHIRIHTGEKPYKCSFCDKSFRFKNVLRSHETMHTGVRRYKCHICGQGFNKTSHLEQHIRTHTGEKPYGCKECNKKFTSKTYWKHHMKKHADISEADSVIAETETSIGSNELISSTQSTVNTHGAINRSLLNSDSSLSTIDASALNTDTSIGMCSSALNTPIDDFMDTTESTLDHELMAKVADTVGCTNLFS